MSGATDKIRKNQPFRSAGRLIFCLTLLALTGGFHPVLLKNSEA